MVSGVEILYDKWQCLPMIRQAITYLMITLLTLQSVVAVADAHQLHQSDTEHLTFEHSHAQSERESLVDARAPLAERAEQGAFDCHHCCHCHGVAQIYTGNSHDSFMPVQSGGETIDYKFSDVSFQASPDNPPPIC